MTTYEILMLVLPIITGATSWVVARRKRDNDFIAELQGSISLLSQKYSESLKELVAVKQQNAALLINQEQLKLQLEALLSENEEMKKLIAQLKPKRK